MPIQSDAHYQLLRLIRVLSHYQSKCLAQNTALAVVGNEKPENRKEYSLARLQDTVDIAQLTANQTVRQELSELEQALADGTDFLPALKAYLDRH